jgi:hypothetical protein
VCGKSRRRTSGSVRPLTCESRRRNCPHPPVGLTVAVAVTGGSSKQCARASLPTDPCCSRLVAAAYGAGNGIVRSGETPLAQKIQSGLQRATQVCPTKVASSPCYLCWLSAIRRRLWSSEPRLQHSFLLWRSRRRRRHFHRVSSQWRSDAVLFELGVQNLQWEPEFWIATRFLLVCTIW